MKQRESCLTAVTKCIEKSVQYTIFVTIKV